MRRREDARFVRGQGLYVDDVVLPGLAWCAFVRSPHAHARIVSVSTRAAAARPGVLLTLTAEDWDRAGHGELTVVHPMPFGDGRPMNAAPRPAFARDEVHHVGDIVAAVMADTRFAAEDAAEAVEVAYDPLPAVITPRDAVAPGAPLVHARFGSNLVFEIERGDRRKTEAAMAAAAKVVELSLNNNRLSANPIEPRSYLCDYDAARDRYTLHATTQQPHYLRRWLSVYTLHIPEHKIRVISPDVGGAFGVKGNFAVEVSTVVWAAQLLRRPVKWTATRTETFLSDAQARDHDTTARMGFDRDGRIVAMQVDTLAALGGYFSNFRAQHSRQFVSADRHRPLQDAQSPSAGARRLHQHRAGRRLSRLGPAGGDLDQRAADRARRSRARHRCRRDPAAQSDRARRFSVSRAGRTRVRFRRSAGAARSAAGGGGLRRAAAQAGPSAERGVLMGIGLAAFIDKAGTGPSGNLAKRGGLHGGWESAIVRVHSDGKVTIFSGSHSHGQGHEITFCQIAADRLGLPIDDISLVEGDTDQVPFGNGTWGARSTSVGGTAIYHAAGKVLDKARRFAAQALECAEGDIDYVHGIFTVRGTDRSISFAAVADLAYHGALLPPGGSPGLEVTEFYDPPDTNDPQAIHLAVVVVDADTGACDCATSCRRRLRRGDQSDDRRGPGARRAGAGIGQALTERIVYDRSFGQLLTASFSTTACRGHRICRRSALPSSQRRRRAIRSASRAQARAAPSAHPPRSATR